MSTQGTQNTLAVMVGMPETGRRGRRRSWAETAAKAPAPILNCDGSPRCPSWDPYLERWEMVTFDDFPGAKAVGKSKAECGDRECGGLHEDDFTPAQIARVRARR